MFKVRKTNNAYAIVKNGVVVAWVEYPYKSDMIDVLIAYKVIDKRESDLCCFEME